jgi:hypothetical protein
MGFGGDAYLIRCGTYQDSEFGWCYFGNSGCPMNPTVVLWTDCRKMQVFSNPRDAGSLRGLCDRSPLVEGLPSS